MAQVINTNVMSLNAQRNLNSSASSLSTSIQRLSSGLRINSAKDDAAGLAISERFTTQIRGLNVAIRNANDGISLAQTAEGAMVEISNNLQRIRELAVQASNATNSASDRKALQAEVKQLTAEIQRVAEQTNFNNTKLLDGNFSSKLFQVGANSGETIGIEAIVNAQISALGATAAGDGDAAPVVHKSFAYAPKTHTVTADTNDTSKYGYAKIDAHDLTIKVNDGTAVTVSLADVPAVVAASNSYDEAAAKLHAANAYAAEVKAKIEADTTLKDQLTVTIDTATGGFTITGKTGYDTAVETLSITGSDFPALAPAGDDDAESTVGSDATNVETISIASFQGAQKAIDIIDTALTQINDARAAMGAIQNRFSSTIANLSTTTENLSASRSRIRDTDYAAETAELTRNQILQQAGTAMLAQANAMSQNVLSLLG